MIRINHTDVYGFDAALRGARNPMNSWDLSDSYWDDRDEVTTEDGTTYINRIQTDYVIGPRDRKLLSSLAQAGPDHGKFLRMITVTADILAPWYWWKEYDTYKIGTVANSCSTMHKLTCKPFEVSDFSVDQSDEINKSRMELLVSWLNEYRDLYIESGEKRYWWDMIQMLPSSYNQLRTVHVNYAVLKAMYHARKNHKLQEWHDFCAWVETLPYAELIIR